MWFYVFLLVLAVLFVVWVSRTNLFHHWRAHHSDPGQQGTGRGAVGGPGVYVERRGGGPDNRRDGDTG